MVGYAKSLCDDIEFSTEDAGRSCRQFLVGVINTAIAAGATTIKYVYIHIDIYICLKAVEDPHSETITFDFQICSSIPDTVGYNTPDEYGELIKYLVDNVKMSGTVTFSTHCHNDLGLATANTVAGIMNGARQV